MLTIDSFPDQHTELLEALETSLQLTLLKWYHSYSRTSSSLIKVAFFNVLRLFRDFLTRRPVVTHASNPSNNEQCQQNTANSNGGNWTHGFMTWPLASNGAEVILWALYFSCFVPRWMAVECWINHAYKEVSTWRATGNDHDQPKQVTQSAEALNQEIWGEEISVQLHCMVRSTPKVLGSFFCFSTMLCDYLKMLTPPSYSHQLQTGAHWLLLKINNEPLRA